MRRGPDSTGSNMNWCSYPRLHYGRDLHLINAKILASVGRSHQKYEQIPLSRMFCLLVWPLSENRPFDSFYCRPYTDSGMVLYVLLPGFTDLNQKGVM
jgi:hypothetical protein